MIQPPLAYLDAGTSSMLLQALLGGVAGLVVYLKARGRSFFNRRAIDEVPEPTED